MNQWETFRINALRSLANECSNVLDFGQSARQDKSLFENVEYVTADFDESTNPDILADICDLNPIGSDSYDGVICFAVLEHVYDPFKAVSEIRRILRPGGMLIGYVPFLYVYHAKPGHFQDYWRFSRDGVFQLLKDFSEIEVQPVRGAATTVLNLLPAPLSRLQPLFYWLDRKFGNNQVSGFTFTCRKPIA